MKIGILETDQLNSDIIKSFGRYGEQFKKMFHRVEPRLKFEYFDIIDQQYPKDIDQCDAYLITGSQYSAYDNTPWVHSLKRYIQQLNRRKKVLIGICFGHQLIAHTLGGKTEKNSAGWRIGLNQYSVSKKCDWMESNTSYFSLLASHQDQVVQLPEKARVIASSDFCPYAGIQIGQHILTFQGHPEFSKEYLQKLIEKRRNILGEALVNQAMESLSSKADSDLVSKWIIDFIVQ